MARLLFPKDKQKEFLFKCKSRLNSSWTDIAKTCNVNSRTIRDWAREKYTMGYDAAVTLRKVTSISIPKDAHRLPAFWNCAKAGRLGGITLNKIHGNPGTFEGRSKGGKKTTNFFRQNKKLAKKVGFVIRKEIKFPKRTKELAELIGIILGDGGLPGNHQLTIAFNYKTDREYAKCICRLLRKLFSVNYYVHKRSDNNGADIIVSSSNLVDFLLKQGLVAGNKVRNQVVVPDWIYKKLEYQIACVRGLMDTDGGVYLHRYQSNGRSYKYLKLSFTNRSKPLLDFVLNVLRKLNFRLFNRICGCGLLAKNQKNCGLYGKPSKNRVSHRVHSYSYYY